MKTTVTYVKRYFKAKSFEVDIPDGLTDEEQVDFLDNIQDNWDEVSYADLDFDDQEIIYD